MKLFTLGAIMGVASFLGLVWLGEYHERYRVD